MNLRISATQLEAFRMFKTEEWFTEDRYLSQIMQKEPPSVAMKIGTAFDNLMNVFPLVNYTDNACYDSGVLFDFGGIAECHSKTPKNSIRQYKVVGEYIVGGDVIEVPCVADAIYGIEAWDYKARTSAMDAQTAERYTQSLQWKLYSDVFDLKRFTYVVVHFEGDEVLTVASIDEIPLIPYKSMSDEIAFWLEECVDYIHKRKLEVWFKSKKVLSW